MIEGDRVEEERGKRRRGIVTEVREKQRGRKGIKGELERKKESEEGGMNGTSTRKWKMK